MRTRILRVTALIVVMLCLLTGCGDLFPKPDEEEKPKEIVPSTEKADLKEFYGLQENEALLTIDCLEKEEKGIQKNGKLYIPLELASTLDTRFYWNETEEEICFTNAVRKDTFWPDQKRHAEGDKQVQDDEPLIIMNGEKGYICTDLLEKYGRVNVEIGEKPARIMILTSGCTILKSTVKNEEGTLMRTGRAVTNPIVSEIEAGTVLYMAEEKPTGSVWTKVVTEDGVLGYVNNLDTTTYSEYTVKGERTDTPYKLHKLEDKICMVWHQVGDVDGDELKAAVKSTKGINVISPTWFTFTDTTGKIQSYANADYVKAAHAAGIQVWALCDDFTPGVKGLDILSHTASRQNLIDNIVSEVTRVGADGINIDFEYITKDSAPHFLQFLRELYLECQKYNLVLSTDNYYPNAPNAHYRLDIQKEFVDYIIFMGYDEHYSLSTEAGSVASITFVTNGVAAMLRKVPAEQLILGVPFFTRKWTIPQNYMEGDVVPNEAMGMKAIEEYVKDAGGDWQWNDTVKQYYVQLKVGDDRVQIWREEETSLRYKLKVMWDNQLAGCAAWKLGLESDKVWDTIASSLAGDFPE